MRVSDLLVTGAAGFVGAALVHDAVTRGLSVSAIVRPGGDPWRLSDASAVDVVEVDLLDGTSLARAVQEADPDYVFHLAAHGAYSWQQDHAAILGANVVGTANLIAACQSVDVKAFLHAGSSSEYGFKDHAPAEDEHLEPNSIYAVGKAAASHLVAVAAQGQSLRGATARLYSVYGPWEDPRRLMPQLVSAALADGWPPLADPQTARDFVYVDDVIECFWALAQCPKALNGCAYNVCSGKQTSLAELVEVVAGVFGVTELPAWGDYESRAWDTSVWCGDPSRLTAATGWSASTPLGVGLQLTGEWIVSRRSSDQRY